MPNKYRDLADIIKLMAESPRLYNVASVEEINEKTIPVMELNQYDIVRAKNGTAVSFAIWAFLNKQAHVRFAATGEVESKDLKSGKYPWVITMVSKEGYGKVHVLRLRKIFNKKLESNEKVYWLRVDDNMKIQAANYGVTY